MKSNKLALKKKAQAMVEFAIVLPILLLLVYGLLETGRLLFIYSTIVTASRQAVRYAATTGAGGNYTAIGGPNNSGISRYQDCFGIRLAAQKVDFLNSFDNEDIFIYYDTGPGTTANQYCGTGNPMTLPLPTAAGAVPVANSNRAIVEVRGDFVPIVRLIPFARRTVANGNPIRSRSARTLLISITIPMNAAPAAEPTTTDLTSAQNPSELGQNVLLTATVSDGASTPTGLVHFFAGNPLAPISGCESVALNGSGVATCTATFNVEGNIPVQAVYDPNGASFLASNDSITQVVGDASTTTTITGPGWSNPGVNVSYHVTVTSVFGIPTGTVTFTSSGQGGSCTINLNASGAGDCVLNFPSQGNDIPLNATYNGDSQHKTSNALPFPHDVISGAATFTSTPKPPATATATATVPSPTLTPTMVVGCDSIRNSVGTLKVSGTTMYLNIPNTNPYPVTIESVRVGWNYANGHKGKETNVNLLGVALNGTTFWTGDERLPIFQVPLPASPLIIPASGTSQIVFTFHTNYNRLAGESIYITFSTPGCQLYPIDVTVAVEE